MALTDANTEIAEGEAMDISHGIPFARPMKIYAGGYDDIMDAAIIVDVVSEFVTLRKRGINYVGLCPFHSDKSPSFYVSPSKNICKCFACGEGGTAVHFIKIHEQLSYFDA